MELRGIQQAGVEILANHYKPEVIICKTPSEVDAYVANRLAQQIQTRPDSVLTLPTGNTPTGMYEHLVTLVKSGQLDLSRVTIFNLDEYHPIDPSHKGSYAAYMRRHLIDQVPTSAWYIPNGQAEDPQGEAARFKALLDAHQPVDLAILGIGPGDTCHIGFNEKGSSIDTTVRYMPLDPQTKATNSQLFEDPSEIPEGTLTQGIADILQAKEIIVIAKGSSKAWGVNRALKGPVGAEAPASFLRLHPHVTFVLDEEAAGYLQ